MNAPRTDRMLLALYPRAWRARYGAELADLLADLRADGSRTWRIRADVVRAAGGERLRAADLLGNAPARSRVRAGSLLVLWAWTLFILAGSAVAKFAEHWSDGVAGGSRRVPAAAFSTLVGAALCAALLVAIGLVLAVPALVAGLRSGLWSQLRRSVGVATGLSVAAGAGTVGLMTWATHLTARQRNGGDLGYAICFLLWAGLGAAVLAAWTSVATSAARRVELSARVLRAQAMLGAAATVAMVVMTAATLSWWVALDRTAPSALHGRGVGVPGAAVAGMVLATALAATGTRRSAGGVRELAS